jgi:hypothetical protein
MSSPLVSGVENVNVAVSPHRYAIGDLSVVQSILGLGFEPAHAPHVAAAAATQEAVLKRPLVFIGFYLFNALAAAGGD